MGNRFVGDDAFLWFFAEVVDIDDEDMLGQYKIKINGFHDEVAEEDLPWAAPLNPIMSASYKREGDDDAIGASPTGIVKGSLVFGFFADGSTAKVPLIFGTIPTIQQGDKDKHDVPKAAREINVWANKPLLPFEPRTPYAAKYPKNKVFRSETGHTIELDDTEGAERIHVYHTSGSYVEFRPDGSIAYKSKAGADMYEIVGATKKTYIADNNIIEIDGDLKEEVGGNVSINVQGGVNINASDNINITSGKDITLKAGKFVILKGKIIYLN